VKTAEKTKQNEICITKFANQLVERLSFRFNE